MFFLFNQLSLLLSCIEPLMQPTADDEIEFLRYEEIQRNKYSLQINRQK